MNTKHFIAIDLGATSGRTILGSFINGKLTMEELTRFPNQMIQMNGHFYWNIFSLYEHIIAGLKAAADKQVKITSIGIDTWGVDFAFIGKDGSMLGMPYAYRDPHTIGAPEEYFTNVMSRNEVYAKTGIQVMNFNSLYQLYTMKRDGSSQLAAADKLLFMPDALSYMLTGNMVTEYTIASTSQLLNPHTKEIDNDLLKGMGLSSDLFCKMVFPGHVIGTLTDSIANATGVGKIPVIAVAGHDTASAVAAVPAANEKFAYLSSGTWSLMGIEVKDPIISEKTAELNITNEGGIEGTSRFLKNITGMWLLEQCLKEWKQQGVEYTYPRLVAMADESPKFKRFIDPDDPSFTNPESMINAIDYYCVRTGQTPPKEHSEYVRCIFESLALKYKYVLQMFNDLAPFEIEKLHIIGGGSKNNLLNQFTANSVGIPVVAGPSEATAIGNIMVQARAAGMVDTMQQMRNMIAEAVETITFMPQSQSSWMTAYDKFVKIINQ